MFVHDGTNILFYRDGVLRASSARPGALVSASAGSYVVLGNQHEGGTASPNAHLVSGRAWRRALDPYEATAYAGNPAGVYERRIWVNATASTTATVTPSRIDSTATFGTATVARTAVAAVTTTRIDSTATFGTATVARTAVAAVTTTRIDSTANVRSPVVSASSVASVTPTRIASTATVPSPVVARAAVATVTATRIESTANIGSHVVAAAGQAYVQPTRIGSTVNVPSPTVVRTGVEQIIVGRIASTASVRAPVVVRTGGAVVAAEYRRFASAFATARAFASPFTQTVSKRSAIDLEEP